MCPFICLFSKMRINALFRRFKAVQPLPLMLVKATPAEAPLQRFTKNLRHKNRPYPTLYKTVKAVTTADIDPYGMKSHHRQKNRPKPDRPNRGQTDRKFFKKNFLEHVTNAVLVSCIGVRRKRQREPQGTTPRRGQTDHGQSATAPRPDRDSQSDNGQRTPPRPRGGKVHADRQRTHGARQQAQPEGRALLQVGRPRAEHARACQANAVEYSLEDFPPP